VPLCVVALRNPYDLAGLPEGVRTVAAYDYSLQTMEALADVLSGRKQATGRLPVRLTKT
jgi:beta-N-acetylhexosaminidase